MNRNNKIFVYGTLNSGLLNDVIPGINLHIQKRRKGKINAQLFDLGEYPGAKPTTAPSKQVFGEIYEIDPVFFESVLMILDDYEEYDPGRKERSLYIRKITPVVTEDGNVLKAWVYWYNKPVIGIEEIETGDYQKHLKLNKIKKNALK